MICDYAYYLAKKFLFVMKNINKTHQLKVEKIRLFFFGFLVLIIGFFTYFYNYAQPSAMFWDENYHIASAYKYLNGVFFMEHHPPLGKMFIALGEYWFGQDNKLLDTSFFLTTDYIKGQDLPEGFSFKGVRFFSTFFAWLGVVLFFLICYQIIKNDFLAFFLSFLYLFENSFIVHNRSAMLEGIQVFFVLLTIYLFLLFFQKKNLKIIYYIVLSFCLGLAIAVKLNSLILLVLVGGLLWRDFFLIYKKKSFLLIFNILASKLIISFMTFISVFLAIYFLHIVLVQKVLENRIYQASSLYQNMIMNNQHIKLVNFGFGLIEHLKFTLHYQTGVPEFDFCKEGENGSLPITWPFMNKTINYRWDRNGDFVSYTYLVGNPIVWFIVFSSYLLITSLFLALIFFGLKTKNLNTIYLMFIFWFMYSIYLLTVSLSKRVIYLYHYFLPLCFGLILFVLLCKYFFDQSMIKAKINPLLMSLLILVVSFYLFFSPLTYHRPLNYNQFQLRNWFHFWHMQAIK